MILFIGVVLVIDGVWSLVACGNIHYPQSPWYYDAGRIIRALLGIALIILSLSLRSKYEIAWAQICPTPTRTGTASWYDYASCRKEGTSGRYTASGKRFNHNALTCASWDYPFGSKLKITNRHNGKSVVVTVNDRGPAKRLHRKGRIIDLSRMAFAQIANLNTGVIKISVEKFNT